MPRFAKESLQTLRERVHLVEVISSHVDLQRAGRLYKGLCPFHEEKTPSFTVDPTDNHYHCFGCGAHGDAIQFLMDHLAFSFTEAVESLAQQFGVSLVQVESDGGKEVLCRDLKRTLEHAKEFFHSYLLQAPEGKAALRYLEERKIPPTFIQKFSLGLSPTSSGLLTKYLREKGMRSEWIAQTGLLSSSQREFFFNRIMIPIHDPRGGCIAFTGRLYQQQAKGGKYINSPETLLFRKSQVLFGLDHCRKRIAKERRALLCEGQLDVLRLIDAGLDFAVAVQGTAFGESHVQIFTRLGVQKIYLAFDSDSAGVQAAIKAGHLLQKAGLDVVVLPMPQGADPDTLIVQRGAEYFVQLIDSGAPFLDCLVMHAKRQIDANNPAAKAQAVRALTEQIRSWEDPVLIHASLQRMSELMEIPQGSVGIQPSRGLSSISLAHTKQLNIDPARLLEADLLRSALHPSEEREYIFSLITCNLSEQDFHNSLCRQIFSLMISLQKESVPIDSLTLAARSDSEEVQALLEEMLRRRVDKKRLKVQAKHALSRILHRNWMAERERLREGVDSLEALRAFSSLPPPKVQEPCSI